MISLRNIKDRYNDSILAEAVQRFGFARESLEELEGSAFVYEGLCGDTARILKITPGVWNTDEQIMGSTMEQMLAEVDFTNYLEAKGVPITPHVRSVNGLWVELIPLDDTACFFVTCFEKAKGFMYPDEDEVHFPEPILFEWGRLCGRLNRLAVDYQPANPAQRRMNWDQDDLLELLPDGQTLVRQRLDETMGRLRALPQDAEAFGLVHGDFHHGNFFVDGENITIFDFDAANYFWYAGEVCTALSNCLPLPRSNTSKRREYSLHYLNHFLKGYRQEKSFDDFWVRQIPLFLKFGELLTYAYFHKYWDFSNLSERRANVLKDVRRRIEEEIPVVEFEPGDLERLCFK
jgi:Ser/Thr protein kinase RdoA (MazF antagonist)